MQIRRAVETDVPDLLPLMRELAEFENTPMTSQLPKKYCANKGSAVLRPTFIVSSPKTTAR